MSIYWNYYLSIEKDLINLSKYIEFNEKNFSTYSIELVKLLMTATQEIDVLFKLICTEKEQKSYFDNKGINDYYFVFKKNYPSLFQTKVRILPYDSIILNPFLDWNKNNAPIWWAVNNKIKHNRNIHFVNANLENVLNAVSALFILNIYYSIIIEKQIELNPPTILFEPENMLATRGYVLTYCYHLP